MSQGQELLKPFKGIFSPLLYAALDDSQAFALIANGQIDLQRVDHCHTFFYLFNAKGYACLQEKHITFDAFLQIPKKERYTLQYAWDLLLKGKIKLAEFLQIPEKKRLRF